MLFPVPTINQSKFIKLSYFVYRKKEGFLPFAFISSNIGGFYTLYKDLIFKFVGMKANLNWFILFVFCLCED